MLALTPRQRLLVIQNLAHSVAEIRRLNGAAAAAVAALPVLRATLAEATKRG
jgi:hypothetical protein